MGVFFSFARGEHNALVVGNIPKGQGFPIWIRRHAGPAPSGSSYPSDNYVLGFKVLKSGNTTPGPDPGNDQFGIRMIYPTNSSTSVSTPVLMNMTDPLSDCRFGSNATITKNADGSYSMGPSARVRMFTSSASGCSRDVIFNAALDTYDHSEFASRGYMYKTNDWKNVEITGYFRAAEVNPSNTSDRKIYLYSRTHRHNTNIGGGCSGTAYKGVIYGSDGELKWHKESFHKGDEPCGDRNIVSFANIDQTDNNQWFGMKLMMWNFINPSTNKTNVHMELWLDLNATNQWIKQGEKNDEGGWYPGAPSTSCAGHEYCGGVRDEIITWGGPITEVRWDAGYNRVDFKWLSCREIVPGGTTITPVANLDPFGSYNFESTKSSGLTWDSRIWNNGISRGMMEGDPDPYDSRFKYLNSEDVLLTINGQGQASTTELTSSVRIFISGPWTNTEHTAWVRIDAPETTWGLTLRSRSSHESASGCRWGGYIAQWSKTDNQASIEVEPLHDDYRRELNLSTLPSPLSEGVWYGYKNITQTQLSTGNVIVKGYICYDIANRANPANWVKTAEYTFTSTQPGPLAGWATDSSVLACIDQGDLIANKMRDQDPSCTLYTGSGEHCWLRINSILNCKVKEMCIREINPLP